MSGNSHCRLSSYSIFYYYYYELTNDNRTLSFKLKISKLKLKHSIVSARTRREERRKLKTFLLYYCYNNLLLSLLGVILWRTRKPLSRCGGVRGTLKRHVWVQEFMLGFCPWIHWPWSTSLFSAFTPSSMATRYLLSIDFLNNLLWFIYLILLMGFFPFLFLSLSLSLW